jgi:protein-disulfide isomerase
VTTKKTPPKKGNRSFITLVAIVLIAGVAIIGYVLNRPKPAPIVVTDNTPLPPAQGYVKGSDSALVEIVEFADFECPACGQFATVTEPDVMTRLVNTGIARFRFVDRPLPMHPNTIFAHNAAACANAQGRFWDYHDRLFAEQPNWSARATQNPTRLLKGYAKDLGLDTDAFDRCLDSRQFEPQIRANFEDGTRRGAGGTPSFLIGNLLILEVLSYDRLKMFVDSAIVLAKGKPVRTYGDTAK